MYSAENFARIAMIQIMLDSYLRYFSNDFLRSGLFILNNKYGDYRVMYRFFYDFLFVLLGCTGTISPLFADPTRTFPRLPESYCEQRFQQCESVFKKLSKKFLDKKDYKMWSFDRPKEEILEEFNQLDCWREEVWYKNRDADTLESQKDFIVSQELLINHHYRKPHLIAFQYNNADASYNCSLCSINGLKFLALEAPSKTSVKNFFNLLHNFQVTHLVRLTPATENGDEKCYPYWEGKAISSASTQDDILNIPLESEEENPKPYKLHYVWTDAWKDHQSGSAQELLDLILRTRSGYGPSSIIAVHCHSGVARTGTFIAGFLLLDEIDRQIAKGIKPQDLKISIEKVVKQLSLQRFYMVGKPMQYLTVYRLVDLYVQGLEKSGLKRSHK